MKVIKNEFLKTIILLTVFGIAFGYIEGSVAHYLRMHYYPEGFYSTLKIINIHTIIIEMIREFCTIVILFIISYVIGKNIILKITDFIFVFAVWDIVYYITLYFINDWPKSIFNWDVLFLIPMPWFAPVISPVIISVIGILTSLIIIYYYNKNKEIHISLTFIILIITSVIFWLVSFLNYYPHDRFPDKYNWTLFVMGIFFSIIGILNLLMTNRYLRTRMYLKILRF